MTDVDRRDGGPAVEWKSFDEAAEAEPPAVDPARSADPGGAQPIQFVPLTDSDTTDSVRRSNGIDLLGDVEVEVTAELGSTRMLIKHILALRPGSVVELDRMTGEPIDITVNNTLIARGEVVVVDEKFAVRVVEIVPPERRLGAN